MKRTEELKKIIRITRDGESKEVGLANSIYDFLLAEEEKEVVPMCGNKHYQFIDNIYCTELDDYVSYKSE